VTRSVRTNEQTDGRTDSRKHNVGWRSEVLQIPATESLLSASKFRLDISGHVAAMVTHFMLFTTHNIYRHANRTYELLTNWSFSLNALEFDVGR